MDRDTYLPAIDEMTEAQLIAHVDHLIPQRDALTAARTEMERVFRGAVEHLEPQYQSGAIEALSGLGDMISDAGYALERDIDQAEELLGWIDRAAYVADNRYP